MDFSKQIGRAKRFLDSKGMMLFLCFLLFLSGAIFSLLFSEGVTANSIGIFVSYLGSLATLLAAVAAFLAIQDWRHQFAHKERFAALIRLRVAVSKLRKMMNLANSLHRIYLGSFSQGTEAEKCEAFQQESRAFALIHQEYNSTLDEVDIFLTTQESSGFPGSRFAVNKLVVKITLLVNDIINEKELEERVKEYVLKVADHEDEIRRVIRAADEYLVGILRNEV